MSAPIPYSADIVKPEDLEELYDHEKDENYQSEQRTDEEYLICREDIACLYLKDQQWGSVLVERLQEVTWAENAFLHLQMEQSKKDIIRTLVTGFDSDQDVDFDDAIQGKGRGLIFLLHGEPGLGKTMTAGKFSIIQVHEYLKSKYK